MSEETRRIEETVEAWGQARLQALAAEAVEVAARSYLRTAFRQHAKLERALAEGRGQCGPSGPNA